MKRYLRCGCIASIIAASWLSVGCGGHGYTDENVPEKVLTDEMLREQMGGKAKVPGEEDLLRGRQ